METVKLNKETLKFIKEILEHATGIKVNSLALGFANSDGDALIHFEGLKDEVCAVVNEIMGNAVAQMPKEMQEVVMAEILSNSKATRVN